MTDQIQTQDNSNTPREPRDLSQGWELELARQVRDLDLEIQPSRNLWSGVERKIEAYPQPKKSKSTTSWMRYGVAASVLMAFSALVLSIADFSGNFSRTSPDRMGNSEFVAFEKSGSATVETLQVEYLKTRDPLVERFTQTNRNLAPDTLEELYRNVEIMAQARRDIEDQVRKDPTNPKLVELLMSVHEQELELLKQDFSQPSRSM